MFNLVTLFGKPPAGQSDCGTGKFQCPNSGYCIPEGFVCNGMNDCDPLEDWDERNCTSIICPMGHFQCNSTRNCVPGNYVCDVDDGCADGSDEMDCKI